MGEENVKVVLDAGTQFEIDDITYELAHDVIALTDPNNLVGSEEEEDGAEGEPAPENEEKADGAEEAKAESTQGADDGQPEATPEATPDTPADPEVPAEEKKEEGQQ